MRRRPRVDANHKQIKTALEQIGASVIDLAAMGGGCFDLLVGFRGVNYWLEVKDGSKPPSRRRLTEDQQTMWRNWRGQKAVVTSVSDAFEAITRG